MSERGPRTSVPLFCALAAFVLLCAVAGAGPAGASAAAARVAVFPSSQTIGPTTALTGGATAVSLNAAIGEREAAWIDVTGAKQISASIDTASLHGLPAGLSWGHYVDFGARDVPDALLPW